MNACTWPTCKDSATHGEYCFSHFRIYGTKKIAAKTVQSLSIPELTEKAQKIFNAWIRDRDRAFGCITCNGSGTEAGHFIPVGENSALRFIEENCHLQCHVCNTVKRGNLEIYRAMMIQKYGIDKVIELETYPKYNKPQRSELERIINTYSLQKAV